jgi:hypothetical protein
MPSENARLAMMRAVRKVQQEARAAHGLTVEQQAEILVRESGFGEVCEALEEAVKSCPCSIRERESGHRTDCYSPAGIAALAKARGHADPQEER